MTPEIATVAVTIVPILIKIPGFFILAHLYKIFLRTVNLIDLITVKVLEVKY